MTAYDNTVLASYTKCPRHFAYRHQRNWRLAGSTGVAIAFGVAWHKAMDVLWPRLCDGGQASINLSESLAAFKSAWAEQGAQESEEKPAYTAIVAEKMLSAYAEMHAPTLAKVKLLGIEVPFSVPLRADGQGPQYCGLIDKVIQNQAGHIIPIDHKTTAAFYSQGGFRFEWVEKWSPSSQMIGYAYACSLLYGTAVPYAIVDASLVHKLHQHFHRQIPVTVTLLDIEEWLVDTRESIRHLEEAKATGCFEKTGYKNGACTTPRLCEYKALCTGGFNWREGAMPGDMTEEEWNPIGRDE